MSRVRWVRFGVAVALLAGAMGLVACGDDDDEATEQAQSALSEAAEVQESVQEQAQSAVSDAQEQASSMMDQAESMLDDAQSAADEATSEAAGGGAGDATAGKAVFEANCSACHTLADAGASGAVGPNLDDVKPDAATVEQMVRNGGGAMPAFEGQLSDDDIANVAAYVSSVAGQ